MDAEQAPVFALAVSAFTSATLLPGTSEALLAFMSMQQVAPAIILLAVASLANFAGSCINYLLGRSAMKFQDRRWFPASRAQVVRAEEWYHRYGLWSLLLSWLPVIGDPLTVIAGALRVPFAAFVVLVLVAKTARYAGVIFLVGLA